MPLLGALPRPLPTLANARKEKTRPLPGGLRSFPRKPDLLRSGFFPAPPRGLEGWDGALAPLILFGGMPGGLGIASAIEPAGGESPLRGGAGVCDFGVIDRGVAPNYRSLTKGRL
jgi:hypothetical protein